MTLAGLTLGGVAFAAIGTAAHHDHGNGQPGGNGEARKPVEPGERGRPETAGGSEGGKCRPPGSKAWSRSEGGPGRSRGTE